MDKDVFSSLSGDCDLQSDADHANRADTRPLKLQDAAEVLGRLGSLSVKIADDGQEIEAALRLRYETFHAEQDRKVPAGHGRDEDRFDAYCSHLIVLDEARECGSEPAVVATYRLMDSVQAKRAGAFYSQSEFDIAALMRRHPDKRFLEFGRSCVARAYRSRRAVELLWHGSWAYVRHRGHDVMFGCASFDGIAPRTHDAALQALQMLAPPDPDWAVMPTGERYSLADPSLAKASCGHGVADAKQLLKHLPPIIKGYLRLGAMFSRDAIIDRAFDTTDVLVMLPVDRLNPRYLKHYGFDADRMARP